MRPEILIDKLYRSEILAEFEQFDAKLFGEIVLTKDNHLCLNYGYYLDPIIFDVTTLLNFKDCYKHILNTFIDHSNWTGEHARWIDECVDSRDAEV